ncbi:hypothetical protein SKA34_09043 [Photobacterium sp. SKA34]|uniref:fimbrial biogenesis chaperone n=1 Tax=Photobacterium sp. SKA34 TaxID=121723 RepID=UPI00006B411E|nr:molecular chaperone [Photobacterium sp. SKA34]EAR57721.1 hypothetical protein SKA34_09043 [Photobacterium sp. SKA34]
MKKLLLAAGSLLICLPAHSSVRLDQTRVIFHGASKSANLSISNDSETDKYFVKGKVEKLNNKNAFIITPPISSLDHNDKITLRISRAFGDLPKDKESITYTTITAIPKVKKDGHSKLVMAIATQVKLIYRPEGISDPNFNIVGKKIKITKTLNGISINNPTPYYINFSNIKLNGKFFNVEKLPNHIIPPLNNKEFKLSMKLKPSAKNTIDIGIINDFGGINRIDYNI